MTSELRREYNVACGYVSALQGCLDHLDRLGMDRMWTGMARTSLKHVAQVLEDGIEFAERGDQDNDHGGR